MQQKEHHNSEICVSLVSNLFLISFVCLARMHEMCVGSNWKYCMLHEFIILILLSLSLSKERNAIYYVY